MLGSFQVERHLTAIAPLRTEITPVFRTAIGQLPLLMGYRIDLDGLSASRPFRRRNQDLNMVAHAVVHRKMVVRQGDNVLLDQALQGRPTPQRLHKWMIVPQRTLPLAQPDQDGALAGLKRT